MVNPDNRIEPNQDWGDFSEITEQYRKYHLALGEFVDAFSRIEEGLHLVLRMRARVPQKVARGGKHEGAFVTTNTRAAHIDARLRTNLVTPQLLQNMTADLYHISEQLTLLSGIYPTNVAARFGEVKRVPWRYKPAEQGSRVLPPHANDRKRLLRHPPFSE